tara:strand:+ start:402 stop:557 length:156 start_codon:yes stop_codon:yes gene_type:complete
MEDEEEDDNIILEIDDYVKDLNTLAFDLRMLIITLGSLLAILYEMWKWLEY